MIMLEQNGYIPDLRFKDLPKEKQDLFRARYEYMTTTPVVRTTNKLS